MAEALDVTHARRDEDPPQFARWIVRNRFWRRAGLLILTTLFFFYPILNAITTALGLPLPGPIVRVDTNARDLCPDHPFIHAQDKFAAKFGSSSLVAIGVVVQDGTIFTPETHRRRSARSRGASTASATTARPTSATRCATSSRTQEAACPPSEIRRQLDRSSRPTR